MLTFTLARLRANLRPSGLASSGALFVVGTVIVNAGNYLSNLVMGRWLGPAAFADLSLVVTILLMVTLVTTALQTVSARFAAIAVARNDYPHLASLHLQLGRAALLLGGVLTGLLVFGSPLWQALFQTMSPWSFVILGAAMVPYLLLSLDRGILQGQTRFVDLAVSYQVEMWVRLVASAALVFLGLSVSGAVAGVSLALVATWCWGYWCLRTLRVTSVTETNGTEGRTMLAFAGPVAAALVGQVLISNSDILIVRAVFAAEEAGQYAALALIGRVVFFATAPMVSAIFPLVTQRQQRGEPHRSLLWLSIALVGTGSALVVVATLLAPELIVRLMLGAAYLPVAPLLWRYAVATALYAVANAIISYRLALGGRIGSLLAAVVGIGQVIALALFHTTLLQVVMVQVVLMAVLFVLLLGWELATKESVHNIFL